ncbi:MAG: 6-carboxytetrahydropterin synthase [Flavobacteriaceae bacterium]|jgi:6-pyruvoyltetrahydropterin/6-carboxytetrahydropterin synthase|nr:6-carboxytetrahydropterin synthase [Pelagibacterales bacterium]MBT4708790.1 6-carboxytetrahydropterin synthase [Flavobacteriaceae bacterium]MBT4959237.1 6-carboxytetrahydropterin synthase [Flavobacteriaceae bacterium]MBT6169701.1 6-carboxytetrahydropterin synthase [Flavobacteriaceae bacterium]MBT6447424.1 6-carboxytetrahydropterin synthase [Flavobacteriaceae bacterium]
MKVTLYRKAHFNAAHRLYVKEWSNKKNYEIFGKCSNPNFHGHNYELIVGITGEINPLTGMVIDLKYLKEIIKNEVEDILDHKNLNLDIDHFKKVVPSVENICIFIWNILRNKIENDKSLEVTLYETPRNFVKYNGNLI